MNENKERLIMMRTSVFYINYNLTEAADLFDEACKIDISDLNKIERVQYLKAIYQWAKIINSEVARAEIEYIVDKRKPAELHYYILGLKKWYLYPALILTWGFVCQH